jgi:uncharacterized protein YndB with AHSA1/START domain
MEDLASQDRVFQTQRTLPYPPDEIYAAFAEPSRLAKWWGPAGFTNTFETFDFSVGGDWKFIMHGPDGTNYNNACVFRVLEPGKKIVIQHACPPYFTLSVSLIPEGAGTQILWVQAFDDSKVAAAVRHIVEPSNEQNLDRLHALLQCELL